MAPYEFSVISWNHWFTMAEVNTSHFVSLSYLYSYEFINIKFSHRLCTQTSELNILMEKKCLEWSLIIKKGYNFVKWDVWVEGDRIHYELHMNFHIDTFSHRLYTRFILHLNKWIVQKKITKKTKSTHLLCNSCHRYWIPTRQKNQKKKRKEKKNHPGTARDDDFPRSRKTDGKRGINHWKRKTYFQTEKHINVLLTTCCTEICNKSYQIQRMSHLFTH